MIDKYQFIIRLKIKEEKLLHLLENIKKFYSQGQTYPSFKTTGLFTRLTTKKK